MSRPLRFLLALVCALCWSSPARAQHEHGQHQQEHPAAPPDQTAPPAAAPAEHAHGAAGDEPAAVTPVPPLTEADRIAAFPDVQGHTVHDRAVHYSVLADQLEWQRGAGGGLSWDSTNWLGGDIHRLWVRSEGETSGSHVEAAEAHVLYGRAVSRWWDLVAGVREDVGVGPSRTWAAAGVQGLAPYWFEIQATAYVGAEGRTHARLEAEYELLLTNRLVLQPLVEAELYGKDDVERRIGAGLSTVEVGARLRYEIRRELAPYIGITWVNAFGRTAELARQDGDGAHRARAVAGLRVWF